MSDLPAFERDPRLREIETEIVESGNDGGRPFVVLADTVFYPEGGGQPADRGTIAGIDVLDVQRAGAAIRHRLASPVATPRVRAVLDWERRFAHMQQHTAQHLLTAVAQDRFGWPTTAFHLGADVSDVELDVPSLSAADRRALEDACAALVREARPVTVRRVAPAQLGELPVRTRGLPEGHSGAVRLVEIGGVDLNTCGGTHLASTAEIECLKLLDTEPMRGGTRLRFVAGERARRRLEVHEDRASALRQLLGASDAELVDAARRKLEQLKDALRRVRDLEDDLAAAAVTVLASDPAPVVAAHWPGRDGGFLQRVARDLVSRDPSKAAFLTADGLFVIAAGASSGLDLPGVAPQAAALMDGRGGGTRGLFQGKAANVDRRGAALALLRSAVRP